MMLLKFNLADKRPVKKLTFDEMFEGLEYDKERLYKVQGGLIGENSPYAIQMTYSADYLGLFMVSPTKSDYAFIILDYDLNIVDIMLLNGNFAPELVPNPTSKSFFTFCEEQVLLRRSFYYTPIDTVFGSQKQVIAGRFYINDIGNGFYNVYDRLINECFDSDPEHMIDNKTGKFYSVVSIERLKKVLMEPRDSIHIIYHKDTLDHPLCISKERPTEVHDGWVTVAGLYRKEEGDVLCRYNIHTHEKQCISWGEKIGQDIHEIQAVGDHILVKADLWSCATDLGYYKIYWKPKNN